MEIKDLFLSELEREVGPTRKTLENLPEELTKFRPHPRSMEFDYLASLVATILSWIEMMIVTDSLDLAEGSEGPRFSTRTELLAAFDESVAKARAALDATSDEHLMTRWCFRIGEQVLADYERHIAIRDAVFMHLAHHRGQLTVYMRMLDAKVPAIYGPSGDEAVR